MAISFSSAFRPSVTPSPWARRSAVSDVICPVTGVVEEVNEDLADAPENLNSDPYGSWIIKVKEVSATEELLDAAAYEAFCATEEA